MPRIACTVWAWLGITLAAAAAGPTHAISPDDYLSLASTTQVSVSPDGRWAVYAEGRWQASTDDRKSDLWIVATSGNAAPRRLTSDRANDREPHWSADSQTIYFLGNRKQAEKLQAPYDGKTQVWKVAAAGGLIEPVTQVTGGVAGFDFANKSNQIYYTVEASKTDQDAFSALRAQNAKLEFGHGKRTVSELWRLDLATWRADKVLDEGRYIREFALTADGKAAAMITAWDDSVLKSEGESRVDVWQDGKVTTPPTACYRANAATPHAWLEGLCWSPSGRQFAFCAIFDGYPAEIVIGSQSARGWNTELIKRPKSVHVHGYGSPLKWHPSGEIFFVADVHGRSVVVPGNASVLEGLASQELPDRVVYHFDFDAAGKTAVYVVGTTKRMPELYRSEFSPGAELRPLVNLNPQAADWKMPRIQHITWKAPDGATVGGVLELPYGHQAGSRLPLVVAIHGGPTTCTHAGLEFDPLNGRLYLAAKGYAVLLPNYRGSTGYGDDFLKALVGNENDIDVGDIVAGVAHLVRAGIADGERVAVMGWSNGGYLTNCLLTKQNLPFKLRAASSGAGILDTAMEWGINDEPAYPRAFKKGTPWEQPELYRKTSPSFGLGHVSAPTLIHVGGNDPRCPPGHSRMLYRALHEFVKVPTELVVYPGEPHGLTKYSNRKAKMDWDLAWFEKYVVGPK